MKITTCLFIALMSASSSAYAEKNSSPFSITLEKSTEDNERNSVSLSKNSPSESSESISQSASTTVVESPAPGKEVMASSTVELAAADPDATADLANAMLVLDMSGSMWGQIDGRTKVEIAREVVGSTVSDWGSTNLGLMAYGHNRKGDCNDIEVLIEPAEVDFAKFTASVNNLQPKGKTPMSEAVRQAAKALRHSEEKATVILVSDGKETCSLDPCAVGKELEASGLDFTAHIIGFDVPEEDTSGLRCLAETTGGVFIAAKNADALKQALNQATSLAIEPGTKPLPVLDPATVDAPEQVAAGSQFLVKWNGPKNRNDRLHTLWSDLSAQIGVHSIDTEAAGFPAVTMIAPEKIGDYIIQYRTQDGQVLGQDGFSVIAVQASVLVPAEVKTGAKFEVSWTGPQNAGDEITFLTEDGTRSGSDIQVKSYADKSQKNYRAPLLPGTYRAQYITKKGTVLAESSFEVSLASISIDAPDQVVAGSKFEVNWSGPQNTNDRLRVTDSSNSNKNYHSISVKNKEKNSSPSVLRAPETPGVYSVHYWVLYEKVSLASDEFEVIPAVATISAPSVVTAGEKFSVEWTGPENQLDDIRIIDVKTQRLSGRKPVGDSGTLKSPFNIRAPKEAGEYQVIYQTKGKNVLASQPLRVE